MIRIFVCIFRFGLRFIKSGQLTTVLTFNLSCQFGVKVAIIVLIFFQYSTTNITASRLESYKSNNTVKVCCGCQPNNYNHFSEDRRQIRIYSGFFEEVDIWSVSQQVVCRDIINNITDQYIVSIGCTVYFTALIYLNIALQL